ncbi:hypothetical protein SDC9_74437 [bioreactor metagenome]|uniref:Uncharacterized protein n=1 Tax=bioreactor metagenome TaxID=1076179 RepID=A0A644YJ54_9ZZZZ
MVEFPRTGFPTNPRLYIKTEKAKLDPEFRFPSLTVARDKGGYEMSFTPARLEIDNSPYFDSVGLRCLNTFTRDTAAQARSDAWEAAANACREGTAVENGASIGDLAMRRLTRGTPRMLTCIEPAKPEISCVKAALDVTYHKDELEFIWDAGGASATYTPYSIDMWVEFLDKTTLEE